jgi:L-seryl-tRNA(Ser) seleniumtransferase
LVEVGTTNRTRLADYERALADQTGEGAAILRVHQSNFRAIGFVEDVPIEALCGLGVPVIDDVGSGVLADAAGMPALGDEPSLTRSLRAGAALVCCSGDKLLGGPQAGLLVGSAAAVAATRRHPLARALRIDKLSLAALEATLRAHRDGGDVPVLAMLRGDGLPERARALAERIPGAEIVTAVSKVGGGALPLLELPGPAIALPDPPDALAAALRRGEPPLLGRIEDGRLLLDPRTLADDEVEAAAAAVAAARGSQAALMNC